MNDIHERCDRCGAELHGEPPAVCPACGFNLAAWRKEPAIAASPVPRTGAEQGIHFTLRELILDPDRVIHRSELIARSILLALFAIWSCTFLFRPLADPELNSSFMHNINLVFHEAGHVLFIPFGELLTVLGGSLFQVMVPLLLSVAFLVQQRDPFAAALCVWWLGQSMLDVSPYIGDARSLELVLLGGISGADAEGLHDWNNILFELGLLKWDRTFAITADLAGRSLMICGLIWAGLALRRALRDVG